MQKKCRIVSSCQSDVGLVRKTNEDFWAQMPEEGFYILADGMGGHKAGEVASKEAVRYMCHGIRDLFQTRHEKIKLADLTGTIEKLIVSANKWVHKLGTSEKGYKGMGTTLCSALFHEEKIIYSHVGDSRIYRFREKALKPLTLDHSIHNELLKKGSFDQSEIELLSYAKRLTRALGTENSVKPDVGIETTLFGDIYLLCSDGLTDLVDDQHIERVLKKSHDLDTASHKLIEMAKAKGGRDNITILLLKVDE
ncbi:MAG: protein phosphatase 2C domain-containing protein [Simkaniaceae bacterium]|nr:protein phosphatase 2C domain-containing protein [Simkaniaceae bacterium]